MILTATQAPVFRKDIQALRALAVGAVIVNHLWPDKLPGGYIGVDIFFVISGYLITSHLLKEAERDGKIALGRFWARRARRLLPASLLVLALCLIFTATLVPVTARADNFTQIGAAAVYIVNWVLASNSLDYFAQDNGHTLVTHFWSLSVEEQFYIVWPILVLLVVVATRSRNVQRRRLALGILFGALIALSFVYALWSTSTITAAAYFQTPGRIWEFAAGGLLSLAPALAHRWRDRLAPVLWLSWSVLLAWTFLLGPMSGVPGVAAVAPVFATMLLIGIGEGYTRLSPGIVTRWRPIQFLGDVSYSAYLWHYPLIIGATYVGIHLTAALKVVLIGVTLVVSYLSKRYVEDPVRAGQVMRAHPRLVLAAIASVMVLSVGMSTAGVANMSARTVSASAALMSRSADPAPCFGAQAVLSAEACPNSHRLADANSPLVDSAFRIHLFIPEAKCTTTQTGTAPVSTCLFGDAPDTALHHLAVVGDSHAMMWLPAIRQIPNARTTTFVRQGCPPTADSNVLSNEQPDIQECAAWRSAMIRLVASDPSIDTVIVAARESLYFTSDKTPASPEGYAQTWREWAAAGKRVIVLADVPEFDGSLDRCLTVVPNDPQCMEARPAATDSTFGRAVNLINNPRVELVDNNGLVCDDQCHLIVGGIPAYADSNHLSGYFVRSIGDQFLKEQLSRLLPR